MNAHGRNVGAETLKCLIHSGAPDDAGAVFHLIVGDVVEKIRRAGDDSLEEIPEAGGTLKRVVVRRRLVPHARRSAATGLRDLGRRRSELLEERVVGDHVAANFLVDEPPAFFADGLRKQRENSLAELAPSSRIFFQFWDE